jgi:hypothetical protein
MSETPARAESAVHRAWRVTEPLHAMIYFVPEAAERYAALGLDQTAGYFASRAAAFGPVGPEPVVATFYNFRPGLVARVLPAAWSKATPDAVLAARYEAADDALRRGLGTVLDGPEVAEAAVLARRAAEAATAFPQGRTLFAAHAGLPWPEPPHLVLWHAQMLLREFRGDGHVAALLLAGLTGLESMILHVASGQADARFLRPSRGWSRPQWTEAIERLRDRGLVDGEEPGLTAAGRDLRGGLEETTDRLSLPAYGVLSDEELVRLAELTRPLSRTIVKAGMLNPANAFGPPRS